MELGLTEINTMEIGLKSNHYIRAISTVSFSILGLFPQYVGIFPLSGDFVRPFSTHANINSGNNSVEEGINKVWN